MTGEEAGEGGAEDGPPLGRLGDAKGLVEIAFEGREGLAAAFDVFKPGVVAPNRRLPREGLLPTAAQRRSSFGRASWRRGISQFA